MNSPDICTTTSVKNTIYKMKLIPTLLALVALSNCTFADVSHLPQVDRHYLPPDPKTDDTPAVYQKVKHISEKVIVHAQNHDGHHDRSDHYDQWKDLDDNHYTNQERYYYKTHGDFQHEDDYPSKKNRQKFGHHRNEEHKKYDHQKYEERQLIDPYKISTPNTLLQAAPASKGQVRNFLEDFPNGGSHGELFSPVHGFVEQEGAASERLLLATAPNSVFHTQINVQSQDSRFNVPNTLPRNVPRAGLVLATDFPNEFDESRSRTSPNLRNLPDNRGTINTGLANDYVATTVAPQFRSVPNTNNNNINAVDRNLNDLSGVRNSPNVRNSPDNRRIINTDLANDFIATTVTPRFRNVPDEDNNSRNNNILGRNINLNGLSGARGTTTSPPTITRQLNQREQLNQRRQFEPSSDSVSRMTFADFFGTNSRHPNRAQIFPSTVPSESTINYQRVNLINGNLPAGLPLRGVLPDQATRNIQGANIINGNIMGQSLREIPAVNDVGSFGRSVSDPYRHDQYRSHHNHRTDHYNHRTDHYNHRSDPDDHSDHSDRTDHSDSRSDYDDHRTDHYDRRTDYYDRRTDHQDQPSAHKNHRFDQQEHRSESQDLHSGHHDHRSDHHDHHTDHHNHYTDHHDNRSEKQDHRSDHQDHNTVHHDYRSDHQDHPSYYFDHRSHHKNDHSQDRNYLNEQRNGNDVHHNDEHCVDYGNQRKDQHDHSTDHHGHNSEKEDLNGCDVDKFDPEASAPEVIYAPGKEKKASKNNFNNKNTGLETASSYENEYRDDGYHYQKPKKYFDL